jgi:hypothetical protein
VPEQLNEDAEQFVASAKIVILAGHGSQIDEYALNRYSNGGRRPTIEIDLVVPRGATVTVWSRPRVVRRGSRVEDDWTHLLDDAVARPLDAASFGEARDALPAGLLPETFMSGETMPNLLLQDLERPGGMPTNRAVRLYRAKEGRAITLKRALDTLQPWPGRTTHIHWSACTQPLYAKREERHFSSRISFGTQDLFEIFKGASKVGFSEALTQQTVAGPGFFQRLRDKLPGR